MSEAVIPVRLADPLLQDAAQEAARIGLSLEEWLRSLAADRVRSAYVTEKFFSRTPRPEDAAELMALLDQAPNRQPDPGDEIEP
jgi:hypothetical protein